MLDIIHTKINEVKILKPHVFSDKRGYFFESFSKQDVGKWITDLEFVQDNESFSSYGVLRGLHFQKPPYAQDKLVRVVIGKVYDVAVDIRKGSPTYGEYVGVELTEENKYQLFIPKGFAHGFVVLSEKTIFQYKCTEFYNHESEGGIAWNDSDINIDWLVPEDKIILSEKDKNRITLKEFDSPFIYEEK